MKLTYSMLNKKREYLPCYIYDYEKIEERIKNVKQSMPENVEIFYSAKANPNMAILRIMKSFGIKVEVISIGEIVASKKASFNNQEILFASGVKTSEEINEALVKGIKYISVNSLAEFERVKEVCKKLNKKVNVLFRISASTVIKRREIIKNVMITKFGIPLKELEFFLKTDKHIKKQPLSLHFYGPIQAMDENILLRCIKDYFETIKNLENKYEIKFNIINIGGGFASGLRKEFPVRQFGIKLTELMKYYNFFGRKIILELGRYLIGEAGYYCTSVIETDFNLRKKGLFIKTQGIINHLFRAEKKDVIFSQRGSSHSKYCPITILSSRENRKKYKKGVTVHILGQLSTVVDCFGMTFKADNVIYPGDILIIGNVGDYSFSKALLYFGSRPMAAEFLLRGNRLLLIRDKGKDRDFLINQKILKLIK